MLGFQVVLKKFADYDKEPVVWYLSTGGLVVCTLRVGSPVAKVFTLEVGLHAAASYHL